MATLLDFGRVSLMASPRLVCALDEKPKAPEEGRYFAGER
jgi:hypothetical protein